MIDSGDTEMKRRTFRLHLLAALFTLALLASSGLARTTDVGGPVRELVEADWIEKAENGDFSLEYTNQLISRGYKLAERLRGLSALESRIEPLVRELRRLETRLIDAAANGKSGDILLISGFPCGRLPSCKGFSKQTHQHCLARHP
jgi:hypothetical protein